MRQKKFVISAFLLLVLIVLATAIWKKHMSREVVGLPQFESTEEHVRLEHEALNGSGAAADRIVAVLGLFPSSDALYWANIGAENDSRNGASNMASLMDDPGMHGVEAYGDYKQDRRFFWIQKALEDKWFADQYGESLRKEFPDPSKMQPPPRKLVLTWKLTEKTGTTFKRAAMRGSPEAAYRLYEHYSSLGSANDRLFWAVIAGQNGHPKAPSIIGQLLAHSANPRDRERAQFWLQKAAINR